MKAFILILIASMLFNRLAAQSDSNNVVPQPIVIEDITKAMSKGTQPGFKIDIPGAKKKGTVDALTKAMRDESRAKLEEAGNEYIIRGTTIQSISKMPLNIYTIV